VVGRTLLSTDVIDEAHTVGDALTTLLHLANREMFKVFEPPRWMPTPTRRRMQRALAALDDVVLGIIEQRRRDGTDNGDLLSMLMHARDEETGEAMDDRQLRDEVMTLFLAGHETTANALTWTWYLLSRHPEAMRRVRAEVERTVGDRPPRPADLPHMPYGTMVLKEAMRLYPPVWAITRFATEDDAFGDYRVPRGSVVLVSQFVTHRHPAFWDNPEGFDPERFAPEAERDMVKYAYFPFGGGPRKCIGNNFALLEAQLILTTVVQHYRPQLEMGHLVELDPMVTLRPAHGMRMTLRPW